MLEPFSTVNDAVDWAERAFLDADLYYGHGTDNAWDDAVALTFSALNIPYTSDATVFDQSLSVTEAGRLAALYQERITTRLPVPYLTHEAWFFGLPFYVDQRVIIPRSPIAELIEHHFSPWIDATHVERILDLCCGSACIAIACARTFPDASVDAIDISTDALAVAQINLNKYELVERVQLIESDLFIAITTQRYDIIVCNPPYVDAEDLASMPPEYQHEPTLALAAGDDGLAIVRKVLATAANHLSEQGILIVEVGNSEAALLTEFPHLPFTWLEFEYGGDGVFLLTKQQLLGIQ